MVWFSIIPGACKMNLVVLKYTFYICCSEFLLIFWYNLKKHIVLSLYRFTKKYISHS